MPAAIALASQLKYEGVFTLQAKGDGPIRLMVADITSAGDVRAYAQFEAGALPEDRGPMASLPALLGSGYLAFTVDQGEDTERYQGIVALEGETLVDALEHYFRQSEQLLTGMVLATSHVEGHWRGGAIVLQRLPEEELATITGTGDPDAWWRGVTLMNTCTRDELLGNTLTPHELLFRLFHEEEVRVFTPYAAHEACRCSEERVRAMLAALPEEEIEAFARGRPVDRYVASSVIVAMTSDPGPT